MIVLIVQDVSVPISELERQPPIATDRYRPAPAHLTFERMQPETGDVHVLDGLCGVQGSQLHPKPFGVAGQDARGTAGLKELAQAFVPERLDHGSTVSRCAPRNKRA